MSLSQYSQHQRKKNEKGKVNVRSIHIGVLDNGLTFLTCIFFGDSDPNKLFKISSY